MLISISILTHNEGNYIAELLSTLTAFIQNYDHGQHKYEIVILDDYSTDAATQMILKKAELVPFITVAYKKHNGSFADQKNALNELCKGEWIINLDADETVTDEFMAVIPSIIQDNPSVEAYWIPRANVVLGLTPEHIKKWNWTVTTMEGIGEIVCWPDYQCRVHKNLSDIKWINKVHEQLVGYKEFSQLPAVLPFAIRHVKNIARQEQQNELYDNIAKGL